MTALDTRLSLIVQHSPDGILIVNEQGLILFANPAAHRLFERPQLQGQDFGFPLQSDSPAELDIYLPFTQEAKIVEMRVADISWEQQSAYLVTLRDVSERKRAQGLVLEHERIQLLEQFILEISHNFKTPLSTLSTGLYLVGRLVNSPEGLQRIEKMQQQIFRLNRLLDNMLDLTYLERMTVLELSAVDFKKLAGQVGDKLRGKIESRKVAFQQKIAPQAEAFIGDEELIYRLLLNLLHNVLDYISEGGRLDLMIWFSPHRVHLKVENSGSAIATQNFSRIFERFDSSDQAQNMYIGGSDLDLAIVKKIVELHQGEMKIENPNQHTSSVLISLCHQASAEQEILP